MVFLFCILLLVTSLAEVLVVQWMTYGTRSDTYRRLYWTDEMVTDTFLFIMVAVMIYRATEGTPLRKLAERLFSGVVTVALLLPFVLFDKWFSNHWFNRSSQLLNFGGAILNLLLWTALLGMRRRDTQLLTVSAGLGVIVTGSAVFYGLLATFNKDPEVAAMLNLGYVLSRCAGLAIWCWAFWRIRKGDSANMSTPPVLETHG
ncbi:MAG TPA: hypothetical protein VGP79_10665 [Bryobacteraceae bacterium]|nr:hypothetical protein [Bryobacteraceae bacterium]